MAGSARRNRLQQRFGKPEQASLDRRSQRSNHQSLSDIPYLVAATVAVALAVPVHAQVDCADWNTRDFFEAAEVPDMTRCLQSGADLEVRNMLDCTRCIKRWSLGVQKP